MPKGRGGIFLIIFFILLILVVVWLLRREGAIDLLGVQEGQIPIEIKNIIPASWSPLAQQPQPCNLDDDPDNEWLVLYRYDAPADVTVLPASGSKDGPIGGVVYDAQVNRTPQELGNVSPYRPALLVPYKLLPDYYTGKGQGYLGENNVEFYPYAPSQDETKETAGCRATELYFLGYSYRPLPTRLSIFRWAGRAEGYQGMHFVGNAYVDAPGARDPAVAITQVTTYNRLDNHRSLLCEVKEFRRPSESKTLNFTEISDSFTIDFCFSRPNDPAYPEAAVVALLRGGNPLAENSPTSASFLTKNADLDNRLAFLRTADQRQRVRILSIANQGTIAPIPGAGGRCPSEMLVNPTPPPTETAANKWWCAGEEAYVEAEIVLGNNIYRAVVRLISIANEQVTADVHWRVVSLKLQ